MDRLLELADGLYALTLPEFTPRRDALVKELKASDKELSAALKTLRKPSVAAWVVNLLVRLEAAQVDQVLTVGVALREAQASLDGDELRALTRQRRQLTAAVTAQARAHAGEAGLKVTSSVADQVEATLTAAMIDERAAAAVRSGLLIAALSATGVDEVEISVAVPDAFGFAATPTSTEVEEPARPELHVVPDPDADEKALAAARVVLGESEAVLARAAGSVEAAVAEVAQLEARSLQLQAEIDELKRRLADLDAACEEADDELSDAEDVKAEAEATLRAATLDRDAAAAAVARLRNRA